MAGYEDLINDVVAIAAEQVSTLVVDVQHASVIGKDAFGPKWGDYVTRQALVEFRTDSVVDAGGTTVGSRAKLTFFESIPITDRDRFIIPDGAGGTLTANTLTVKFLERPDGTPYMVEVWLGDRPKGVTA